ncbi:MAG: hypothetical protein J2P28_25655, partial [Actinobacteria bacterium]|nr:hypothetical protein [Actinomycetota bacterium]
MAESSGPGHGPQWPDTLVSELRAISSQLDVPTAGEQATAIRRRLQAQQRPQTRQRPQAPPKPVGWHARIVYPRWRAAVIVALTVAALAVAIPQSRAVIAHVLRLDGVEFRPAPGPSPAPHPSLPGEQRMSLEQARQRVEFPILVPTKLGRPAAVTVSDSGRVATLIYDHTPHGPVRLDEFDGHLDPLYFEKFVAAGGVTEVRVNGTKGLWVTGPQEVVYVRSDGMVVEASARLTTGSTLIWGTPRVVLRLEGAF